jgi:hypothetical protein
MAESEKINVEMKHTLALGVRIKYLLDTGEKEVLTTVLNTDEKNTFVELFKGF